MTFNFNIAFRPIVACIGLAALGAISHFAIAQPQPGATGGQRPAQPAQPVQAAPVNKPVEQAGRYPRTSPARAVHF